MDSSPTLTRALLIHFAKTGEWGKLHAHRIQVGQGETVSSKESDVFIGRGEGVNIWIPNDGFTKRKWPYLRVFGACPTGEYSPVLTLQLYKSELTPTMSAGKCEFVELYRVDASGLRCLLELVRIATLELTPFVDLLNSVQQQTVNQPLNTPIPEAGFDLYVNWMKLRIRNLADEGGDPSLVDMLYEDGSSASWAKVERMPGYNLRKQNSKSPTRGYEDESSPSTIDGIRQTPRAPSSRRRVGLWSDGELRTWFFKDGGDCHPGGPSELSFTEEQVPRIPSLREFKDEKALKHAGLWWWNDIPKWPRAAQELFEQNWLRSAFYYELLARETNGSLSYWPFEVPWAWLGYRQRAALYYLWPPVHGREFSFHGSSKKKLSPERYPTYTNVIVDVSKPWKAIKQYIVEKQRSLSAIMGQSGSPSSIPHTQDEGTLDWWFLEELDRSAFLKYSKVSNNLSVQRPRVRKRLEAACSAVKLDLGVLKKRRKASE